MVDIDPLYELIQLITDFLPVIIIIVAILFFIGLIFMMLPARGKLANKLRIDKRMIIAMIIGLTVLISFSTMPGSPATNAVAIKYDSSAVFGGTMMTVELTGLTVNTEYTIFASSNTATFTNVTLVASAATEFVPVPVLDETDGYYLGVSASTAGQGAVTASVWVAPRDVATLFPTDFFFNLMVPIILVVIVVGIAASFVKSQGRRGA